MQLANVQPATSNSADPRPADTRLARSAHEFEASLMSELLKPLQHGDALTGGEDEGEQGSEDSLASFASESLARVMSERGGFGIADRILKELRPPGAAQKT